MSDQDFWTIAVLFEDRPPEWMQELTRAMTNPVMRAMAEHPMRWETRTYRSREIAEAELGILREMVAAECTCGNCPFVRDVRLAYVRLEAVDIGLGTSKPIDPPTWWGEVSK